MARFCRTRAVLCGGPIDDGGRAWRRTYRGDAVLWAHSVNAVGRRHTLVDHLWGTGQLAEGFASAFGAGDLGRFLGEAHDVGKASCAWQAGLLASEAAGGGRVTAGGKSVDHKSLGVELARRRGADLLGLALHGHHGGLTSPSAVRAALAAENTTEGRERWVEAEAALAPLLPGLFGGPALRLPPGFGGAGEAEVLVRFLYSCLVDADALDTEAHRNATSARVAPDADMGLLWDRFSARRKTFLDGRPVSAVDRWRSEVYEACLAAAEGPTGIYRLPAPTGAGKTIASAAFALRHAALLGKKRVIVAVPFTTITEQNAGVYRRLLDPEGGAPVVLEHHTHVAVDESGGRERWRRLAAENWDAPFVVTTTVQLFESLFGRKPSRMRKVHRLANAVVVLDEVQALPAALLVPIVDALRTLSALFGTTVLLASATQPELFELGPLRDTAPREVIAQPGRLYGALRRVRYRWWTSPKPTLEEVADEVARPAGPDRDQALVVVNTRPNAQRMYELVGERVGPEMVVRHLSTYMCAAHRAAVLAEVKELLGAGQPVRLVSTQLIEAGVDIDFPVVYRALAPADALQQSAGRANREGALGFEGGLVVIFDPDDGGAPPAYKIPVEVTREVMGAGIADPDDLLALQTFYRQYLLDPRITGPASRGQAVQTSRKGFDFHAVTDGPLIDVGLGGDRDLSKAFRMITEDTVPVVVSYGPDAAEVEDLVAELGRAPVPDMRLVRALQPYLVQLRRADRGRPEVAALCRPIVGDLAQWLGDYDKQTGLRLTQAAEDFIS
ncbi:CRISPR-associated helicase Cas3' [Frankia nepalensis]|uniref:CRISPR-associated helicase Cas3 n=1 Tax=Frankia nepalensis TaxID=1836974 RepID=A0A937USC7_9ACTN|nr:CRISPR-associated helicase Cas3' [Frankia nepalensis]MBL7631978.1 CRISPR-associated helicase Cas3' [Frankia nepalensis]